MIRCVGNIREGADGRYFVTCRGKVSHLNAFHSDTGSQEFVDNWIRENCQYPAEIYGYTTVVFQNEGEAALFWMTFRKDRAE